ncbi:helix-turn-helix transcriptional regulator [Pseudomonas sp.]|uniref:helix-turn-helix domain-containing protein n=1 Tax=Pseudomonas sp. TaxID=306 RepID=UPI0028B04241|nr:helix-turn-helix transcriptional regulator [Pseudomonas sp.]
MSVQIIRRDGVAEYAVLPWNEYQALLKAQTGTSIAERQGECASVLPLFAELAGLRERKGLAAETLARAVGISPAYLALIERGERDPGDVIRRSLARALEIEGWRPDA